MNQKLTTKFGLTLIEMLIVLAVIVILVTMVIGIASHIDTQSKEKGLKSTFAILEGALEEYKDFKGQFPLANLTPFENSEILYRELSYIPSSRKILEKVSNSLIQNRYGDVNSPPEIYDLWGTVLDYRYDLNDSFPLLISAGRDRTFGTADDINNR